MVHEIIIAEATTIAIFERCFTFFCSEVSCLVFGVIYVAMKLVTARVTRKIIVMRRVHFRDAGEKQVLHAASTVRLGMHPTIFGLTAPHS